MGKKSKKRQKLQQSANIDIASVCHVAGLSRTCASEGDLLNELSALQQSSANIAPAGKPATGAGLSQTGASEGDSLNELTPDNTTHSIPQSPPLDQVPNIRVELARHLHI